MSARLVDGEDRADHEHRGSNRAEHGAEQAPGRQEGDVHQRRRSRHNLDVDTARDCERHPHQDHERQEVHEQGVPEDVQSLCAIVHAHGEGGDGAEHEAQRQGVAHLGLLPPVFPFVGQQWREGHHEQQRRERRHEKVGDVLHFTNSILPLPRFHLGEAVAGCLCVGPVPRFSVWLLD